AKALGAKWAGGSDEMPPEKLDAAIIFASVGPLVPVALHVLAKGGIVVCGGIHMTDIPSFPYTDLWEERIITSVANLTRRDGEEFFDIAPRVPVKTKTETFPLEDANIALDQFRSGELKGTAVIVMDATSCCRCRACAWHRRPTVLLFVNRHSWNRSIQVYPLTNLLDKG